MFEGMRSHLDVWRESWRLESERRKSAKKYEEVDFLPAALEILEKPASPVGRTTLWLIIAFFVAAMLWSYFGHVDVVATAQGRIIPKERVKIIQPLEIGVVRAIKVTDGQRVAAGDVLIELDPTVSGADVAQVEAALLMSRMTSARANALLAYVETGAHAFDPPADADPAIVAMEERLIDSQIREYEAALGSLAQQRAEREADLAAVDQEIDRLKKTLPLIEEQVAARKELTEKGLSPRLLYLELLERLIDSQKQLEIQTEQRVRMTAAISGIDQQSEQTTQEFRGTALSELAEAETAAMAQTQELTKAAQRNVLQQLVAPVDGTVQQLAIHTIGGIVQPAEPLMVIVPGEGDLVVEAQVLNKDIGFVHIGDEVEVKLEAFPFTKYGTLPGTLEDLSQDAIADEKLGLVYQARVSLERSTIAVNDKDVNIAPGMVATAEIKTGKRRLIEFILSPLLRYKDESLRER
ncbi:MAG: HlyD family type I secretion periplasmic adaptor subunit [Sphingomonadales bacterium]|nr:HlyD family type I secretion periplasmic adaptor subunit [Sphingomonadales bacterium]